MPIPGLTEAREYLGATSATDAQITSALAAETANQKRMCRIPQPSEDNPTEDVYPVDLGEALLRRVARNLAARAVPVASQTTFDGGVTSTRVTFRDAEVTRLEAPWRRMTVG